MTTTLKLNASAIRTDPLAGWDISGYALTTAARDAAQAEAAVSLAENDVLELEPCRSG
jgi:hypothetical protein